MAPIGLLMVVAAWAVVGSIVLLVTMLVTTPTGIGPIGVTLWFVLVFTVLASLLSLALYGIKSYFRVHATRQQRLRYSLRQGMLISGWVIGMLALASLGGVGIRDGILLGLTAVIIELYVRFRWP